MSNEKAEAQKTPAPWEAGPEHLSTDVIVIIQDRFKKEDGEVEVRESVFKLLDFTISQSRDVTPIYADGEEEGGNVLQLMPSKEIRFSVSGIIDGSNEGT